MEDPAALDPNWLLLSLLALVLGALGAAAYRRWQRHRHRATTASAQDRTPDLDRLGLSPVRTRAATPAALPLVAVGDDDEPWDDPAAHLPRAGGDASLFPDDPPNDPAATTRPWPADNPMENFDETGVSSPRPLGSPRPAEEAASPLPKPAGPHLSARSPLWKTAVPRAVGALLESLAAALDAHSVALLRHDEYEDAYAVDALAGRVAAPRVELFTTEDNALHRVPDDRSISLIEADTVGALRYLDRPHASVGHATALSVDGPPVRVLLVVAAAAGADDFSARALTLLGEYADLLGHLLHVPTEDGADDAAVENDADDALLDEVTAAIEAERAAVATPPALAAEAETVVRPRVDIIAEEMAAARTEERPLALALVVLRDTEALEADGRAAVDEAEEALFARLRQLDRSTRVEKFGELLAGVFCHAGPTFVESWVERATASGPPLHIGVTHLRARHLDAAAFRADAAAALRAAYERGEDCAILE